MARPREGLRSVAPYRSPSPPVPVRLNTNECPYPLPEAYMDDLSSRMRSIPFHRYPDNDAVELRTRLGERIGRDWDGVWVANGSNEVLHQLLLAYGGPGRRAVMFEPTYALHGRLSWISSTEIGRVQLAAPFEIEPSDIEAAVAADADVAFVCSPNNPTGGSRPVEVTATLARSRDWLVIVDEAYIEFGGESAAPSVQDHPNVVVVRTFSKAFALAGARIGYCIAAPEVISDLQRVRLPYHLSALTQAAGLTALDHEAEAMEILDTVRAERDRMLKELQALPDVQVFRSDANFVLFRPPRPAADVWQALVERGVLIRDLSNVVPGCLRVTAGTPEEVDRFLDALREVLR